MTDHLDGARLDALWDFADLPATLERLRSARDAAAGVERDELTTQVARALGLLERFEEGAAEIIGIEGDDPVVTQRVALEKGRLVYAAGRPDESVLHLRQAVDSAADPYLTVDALHMLAIVEPAREAEHTEVALALVRASDDPRVRRWEGPLLNNHAWNLADSARDAEALAVFREAETWFTAHGKPGQIHVARWAVAHLLRRTGDPAAARAILVDLAANDPEDPYVTDELEILDEVDR